MFFRNTGVEIVKTVPVQCLCENGQAQRSSWYGEFVRCANCGLIHLPDVRNTYDEAYFRGLNSIRSPEYAKAIARNVVSAIEIWMPREKCGKQLTGLDYGCGNGDILAELRRAMADVNWIGYDPHAAAHRDVRFGGRRKADIVYCGHVLEHVPNPVGMLTMLASFTSKTALLYITVPWETGLWKVYKMLGLHEESTRTEHVTLWNRSLLVTALERAGWRVLEVQNDDTAKYVDPNRRKMLQERAWLRAQAAIGR